MADAGLCPQNALVSFKELCGLTPAANMKQCILTVATWFLHSDSAPSVTLNLAEQYPPMEAQGPIPELLRKVLTAYETVSAGPPGLSPLRDCSRRAGGAGCSPLPGTGDSKVTAPILVPGEAGGGLRGGCPARSLVEAQARSAPCEPWDPTTPCPHCLHPVPGEIL